VKNSVDTPLNDAQRVWVKFSPPGYNAAGHGRSGSYTLTNWTDPMGSFPKIEVDQGSNPWRSE